MYINISKENLNIKN